MFLLCISSRALVRTIGEGCIVYDQSNIPIIEAAKPTPPQRIIHEKQCAKQVPAALTNTGTGEGSIDDIKSGKTKECAL